MAPRGEERAEAPEKGKGGGVQVPALEGRGDVRHTAADYAQGHFDYAGTIQYCCLLRVRFWQDLHEAAKPNLVSCPVSVAVEDDAVV